MSGEGGGDSDADGAGNSGNAWCDGSGGGGEGVVLGGVPGGDGVSGKSIDSGLDGGDGGEGGGDAGGGDDGDGSGAPLTSESATTKIESTSSGPSHDSSSAYTAGRALAGACSRASRTQATPTRVAFAQAGLPFSKSTRRRAGIGASKGLRHACSSMDCSTRAMSDRAYCTAPGGGVCEEATTASTAVDSPPTEPARATGEGLRAE